MTTLSEIADLEAEKEALAVVRGEQKARTKAIAAEQRSLRSQYAIDHATDPDADADIMAGQLGLLFREQDWSTMTAIMEGLKSVGFDVEITPAGRGQVVKQVGWQAPDDPNEPEEGE